MKVKCPKCHTETLYDSSNKYRPFCSERCATLDLGAWADEEYKVPVEDFTSEFDDESVNENEQNERGPRAPGSSKDDLN